MSDLGKVVPKPQPDDTLAPLNDVKGENSGLVVDSARDTKDTTSLLIQPEKPTVDANPDEDLEEITEEEIAVKLAQKKKELEEKVKRSEEAARKKVGGLLCGFLKEQWWLILLGVPFMFLGPLGDLVVPSYIGFVCSAMMEVDNPDRD
jgi:hypothetical protein